MSKHKSKPERKAYKSKVTEMVKSAKKNKAEKSVKLGDIKSRSQSMKRMNATNKGKPKG